MTFKLRPPAVGLAAGAAAFAVLLVAFRVWVHYSFGGCEYGPFLTTEKFGVPSLERSAGVRPVCYEGQMGWDGQYYYFQSNDPFMTRADLGVGFDNLSYRYQRNGVPLLAYGISRIVGSDVTPPLLYHVIQIAFVAAGFGVLAGWLSSTDVRPAFALCWLFAGGTIYTLFHGVADPVSDACFIFALSSLTSGRLLCYAAAATFLLLCREAYASFAAPVFALSALGVFGWRGAALWRRSLLTALPGVVLLGWTAFVAHALGAGFMDGARSVGGGQLLDSPFAAALRCLRRFRDLGDLEQARYLLVSVFTLIAVGVAAARHARRSAVVACALPMVVLTTMTGDVMWSHHTGHLKNNGPVVILALAMLPLARGSLLRVVLMLNVLAGLNAVAVAGYWEPPYCSPDAVFFRPRGVPAGPANADPVSDRRCRLEWVERPASDGYAGPWSRWHRPTVPAAVRLTNLSGVPWHPAPADGPLAVNLNYRLLDGRGRVRGQGRFALPRTARPGEPIDIRFAVRLPARPGTYRLIVTAWQPHNGYFADRGGGALSLAIRR